MFLPNSRKQTRIVISFCNIINSIVIECELTIFVAVFVASSIKNCFRNEKAKQPILVTLFGIVTEVKPLRSTKNKKRLL